MERNLDINTVLPSSVQVTNTQETMLSRRGNNKRQKPENRTPQRFSPQLMKSYWSLAHPVSVVSFVTSFSAPSHRPLRCNFPNVKEFTAPGNEEATIKR